MMKRLLSILVAFAMSLPVSANDSFISKMYPKVLQNKKDDGSPCRLMSKGNKAYCLQRVIKKDFRKSGDYLYYVVLGQGDDCFACSGVVDIYAISLAGKLVAKKSIEMGSWGMPDEEWQFKKTKNGKIMLLSEECEARRGDVNCVLHTFSLNKGKFIHNLK